MFVIAHASCVAAALRNLQYSMIKAKCCPAHAPAMARAAAPPKV
jgi:hypothetical protein